MRRTRFGLSRAGGPGPRSTCLCDADIAPDIGHTRTRARARKTKHDAETERRTGTGSRAGVVDIQKTRAASHAQVQVDSGLCHPPSSRSPWCCSALGCTPVALALQCRGKSTSDTLCTRSRFARCCHTSRTSRVVMRVPRICGTALHSIWYGRSAGCGCGWCGCRCGWVAVAGVADNVAVAVAVAAVAAAVDALS